MDKYTHDWSDLAFGSKKPLRSLGATLIAAPRTLSTRRFAQLVKDYLPLGPIIVAIAKEPYIEGFEGQEQFKSLDFDDIKPVVQKVNAADTAPYKIHVLYCFQRELPFIIDKLACKRVVFVNGSWKYMFHTRPLFYDLTKRQIPHELVSPFADEQEAIDYAAGFQAVLPSPGQKYDQAGMLALADTVAAMSFDYGFQTGVTLGRNIGGEYELVASGFNEVVPFQAHAMHYGASREANFSPTNDLNHYDTIHAEVSLMIDAQKRGIDLRGTTLFINLLPCPSCARMFTKTDVDEFVYRQDHSDGYAVKMLEKAGKKVTRIV